MNVRCGNDNCCCEYVRDDSSRKDWRYGKDQRQICCPQCGSAAWSEICPGGSYFDDSLGSHISGF